MAWFSHLFGRKSVLTEEVEKSLAGPTPELLSIFGLTPTSASGITVTPETALCAPVVLACVRIISEVISTVPLHLYRRTANDGRERLIDDAVENLLSDRVNPWTSSQEFFEKVLIDALCHDHGGFGLIIRDLDGKPAELHHLPARAVSVEGNGIQPPTYKYSADGITTVYPASDILHITNGCKCPVTLAREAIALSLSLEKHASGLFGKDAGRPSGTLTMDGTFKQGEGATTVRNIMAAWRAAFKDGQSGGVIPLDAGLKFTPITFNPVDSQFIEQRQYQNEDVCRAFGVPIMLAGDFSRSTWGTYPDVVQSFLQFGLEPWLKRVEDQVRLKLVGENRPEVYAEYTRESIVSLNITQRYSAYQSAITARWMTPAEVRSRENLPFIPGTDTLSNPFTDPDGALNDTPAPTNDKDNND